MGLGFRRSCFIFLLFLLTACGGTTGNPSDTSPILIEELTFTDAALKECVRQHVLYRAPEAKRVDQLTELKCEYEYNVQSLADLTAFSNLKTLIVRGFSAPTADVSGFKLLTHLGLEGALERIEIADHVLLNNLSIHSHHLKKLSLAGLPALETLSVSFGQEPELLHIEAVPRLEDLYLSNIKDTPLDLHQLRSLRKLEVHDGARANFDTSLLPSLEELNLYIWSSKPLDLSQNLRLKVFGCFQCVVGGIEFAEHSSIESIKISSSDITDLVIPSAEHLAELELRDNEALGKIALPAALPKLAVVDIYNSRLRELPAAQWPKLRSLSLANNRVESVDLSTAVALETLDLANNKLTDVDLSANYGLVWLSLANNALTQLDVSNVSLLQQLNVGGNQLVQLDVNYLPKLTYLNAGANYLSSLDVSALLKLDSLHASGNEIASLILNPAAPLRALDVSHNRLSSLDLSEFRINLSFQISAQHNELREFKFPDLEEPKFLFVYLVDLSHNQLQSLRLKAGMHVLEAAFAANPLAELEIDSAYISSLDISQTLLDCEFFRGIETLTQFRCGEETDTTSLPN